MLNPWRRHYKKYYIQKGKWQTECTRAECFSLGEDPTPDNPYRQRWFYDPAARFAVRLERTKDGEELHHMNEASIKWWERSLVKYRDMLSIDDVYINENGELCGFELPANVSVEEIVERRELLRTLLKALEPLPEDMRLLWRMNVAGTPKNRIAEYFGISRKAVWDREQKLWATLRRNPALKSFFEEF